MSIISWKVSKYGVISGRFFPVLGLNKEIYGISLLIQSQYRKIRTRNNSAFGHFSRSVYLNHCWVQQIVQELHQDWGLQCNQRVWIVSYLDYAIWISATNGSPSEMFDRVLNTSMESMGPAVLLFSCWRFVFFVNLL